MKPPLQPFVCLILVALVGWTSPVRAQTPPEHIEAYVLFVQAEQEEQRGRLAEAIELYRQSKERYREVVQRYPEWQPEVVRYRLVHAQNQIDRLQRLVPAEAREPEPESPQASSLTGEWEAAAEQWNEEKSVLELAIDELESERMRLRQQLEALTAEAAKEARAQASEVEKLREAADTARQIEKERADLADEWKRQAETLQQENQQLAGQAEVCGSRLEVLSREMQERELQMEAAVQEAVNQQAAWATEREQWVEQQRELRESLLQAESLKPLVDEHARLQMKFDDLVQASATLSNQVQQLETREKEAQRGFDRLRKDQEAERDRLVAEVSALKQTVDAQQSDLTRVRELRATIRRLEKENKELAREADGLNRALEKAQGHEELNRLRSQNTVLMEELRVFRSHLANAEQRNRELERANAALRQGATSP